MPLRYAKRLHNGDQVTIKGTDVTVEIHSAYPHPEDPKIWLIELMTPDGWAVLTHWDIA